MIRGGGEEAKKVMQRSVTEKTLRKEELKGNENHAINKQLSSLKVKI